MDEMRFGHVARLSPSDYARWQAMVRTAATCMARVERPEVEGEPFRLRRFGEVLVESERMEDVERVLSSL